VCVCVSVLCVCVCVCLIVCVYERGIGVGVSSIHRLEYVATNERINGRVKGESVCVFCVCVCVCVCVLRGRGKEWRRLIHVQPRNKATVLISKAVIQKCKYGGTYLRTNKRGY
jgi:hypothetical protein